ncbi:hypothetical protein PAPYR_3495 [Paratrimastix pyriformis]|uniref:F5/8 type C domain-containing protein n=1 Tax=Paratrimastix pyriformis TaxID=342808 RepID=A0ABQ8UMP8_9EUKA|nr:hypothetical protein PAPYR_3495 [Paratrimastix pyriformis]
MLKNLTITENGGAIEEFSSQYHHESRCLNLLTRDPTLCWFTDVSKQLPQHVILRFAAPSRIYRVGIYLHGENNQNPKHIQIWLSPDKERWTEVVDAELEQRGGDHLFDLPEGLAGLPIAQITSRPAPLVGPGAGMVARYVKYVVTDNFGGSGIYTTKIFAFGLPEAQ